jgi:hypothetical protein
MIAIGTGSGSSAGALPQESKRMSTTSHWALAIPFGLLVLAACGSAKDTGSGAGPASGTAGTSNPTTSGTSGTGVGTGGTNAGTGGAGGSASPGTGGTSSAGASNGGSAGQGASGGGQGGTQSSSDGGNPLGDASGTGADAMVDTGDTKPWRPLNVTAAPGQHTHNYAGNAVGLDNRAAKMMGKLIIDLGVDSGGYWAWAGKRGFHVFGVSFYHCAHIDDWSKGSAYPSDCRLNTFDGIKHANPAVADENTVTPDMSISGKVKAGLASLHQQFSEEDWGYFLNQDGSVRWSDVAFEGYSHGAQTAARIGRAVRLYRAVSRSGPRDNGCGTGAATGDFDPLKPPYDPNCPAKNIATWQDEGPATPIDRFFGFAGKQDGQYGDDMFSMEHMHYVGMPVNISTAQPPYGGSHRFYADTGHVGFDNFTDALNIAFGVPPENQHPTF